jgi:hypothetical protein
MNAVTILETAKAGDITMLERLVAGGTNVNEQDEHGWSALCWASGRGDAATVSALLQSGADVTLTGRDGRTPLMIARAANRTEVIGLLTAAEQARGVWQDPRASAQYCKAYVLKDLQQFPDWQEQVTESASHPHDTDGPPLLTADDVVFVHQDLTVTRSMWHGEDVIYADVTPAWEAFCRDTLAFRVADDLL